MNRAFAQDEHPKRHEFAVEIFALSSRHCWLCLSLTPRFREDRSNPRAVRNRFRGLSWHDSSRKPLKRLRTCGLVSNAQLKQGVNERTLRARSLHFLAWRALEKFLQRGNGRDCRRR